MLEGLPGNYAITVITVALDIQLATVPGTGLAREFACVLYWTMGRKRAKGFVVSYVVYYL